MKLLEGTVRGEERGSSKRRRPHHRATVDLRGEVRAGRPKEVREEVKGGRPQEVREGGEGRPVLKDARGEGA